MARRAVMKESSKWRSCRALERGRAPPRVPQALAEDERVAAEDDGDVVRIGDPWVFAR
jgi:hypothetical protein